MIVSMCDAEVRFPFILFPSSHQQIPAEFWQMLVPSHREQLAADPHALACLEVWRNIIHTVWLSDTPPPADYRASSCSFTRAKKT